MFIAAYFIGLFFAIIAFGLWLIAGYLAGRLRGARTVRTLRRTAWGALAGTTLGTLIGGFWLLLNLAGLAAAGPRIMAGLVVVQLPMVTGALAAVIWFSLPGLWRAVRTPGDPSEPVPSGTARALAEPRLVIPLQVNAVVAFLLFYLGWFTPPAPPFWGSALLWWTVLAVIIALLVARQVRRRDSAVRRGVAGRSLRGFAVLVTLAVAMTGCSVWGVQSSKLSDRHSMSEHGEYDLGGGPELAGMPSAHGRGHGRLAAGRPGATAADAPKTSVDDLKEKDLSGPVMRRTLTARTTKIALASGKTVDSWTFDGKVPGPELRVRQGDLVEVTLVNADVKAGVTLHWHRYDVPNAVDGAAGVTQNAVPPGQRHVYRFRARDAGTYWYHSHQQSSEQVSRGLYGALIVEPAGKPAEKADIPVLMHQWDTDDGSLQETFGSSDRPENRRMAPGTPVRLRLINSGDRPEDLTVTGTPYRVVAIDGGNLTEPGEIRDKRLNLAAGGRYDVTFTMPDGPVALAGSGGIEPAEPGLVLSPDGKGKPPAVSTRESFDPLTYGTRRDVPFGPGTKYDRHFTLDIDHSFGFFDGAMTERFRVNGRVFPDIPTLAVREGETIKTTFVNRSYQDHPMHLHGHHMLVLARNGKRATGSAWWTDTLNVPPGEIYEVAFKADNRGAWMDHCHNLRHARNGMMLHLLYEGVTSPYETGRGTPNQPE